MAERLDTVRGWEMTTRGATPGTLRVGLVVLHLALEAAIVVLITTVVLVVPALLDQL